LSLYQLHVLICSLALMPAHAQRVLSGHMHTRRIEAHIRSPDCPRARSSGSKRQRWPQHKTVQCSTHIAQSLKAWYRLVLVRTCHTATTSSRRERLRQPGTIQRNSLHPRSSEYGLRPRPSDVLEACALADRSTRAVMLVMAAMRLQAASTSCAMCSSHSAQTGSSTDLVAPLLLAATAYHGQRLCEASAHDDSLQSNGVVSALSVLEF
jgi:hypothetical protein